MWQPCCPEPGAAACKVLAAIAAVLVTASLSALLVSHSARIDRGGHQRREVLIRRGR